eukprot:gene22852-29026_t
MDEQHQDHFDSRERSRSRDRPIDNLGEERTGGDNGDGYEESNRDSGRSDHHDENHQRNDIEVFNLYVTNLSFQTTDESLRAAFEQFGEIHNVSVIKEPVTHTSRGFGFVSFIHLDDSTKAIENMNGGELDSRTIRVEKARRNTGYTKTPGVYLGPPQLSSRFVRDDSRGRDRGGPQHNDRGRDGGNYDNRDVRSYNGGGGGGGFRGDVRGGGGGYRGGGGYDRQPGGYREERYPDMQQGGMRGDPRGYNDYRGGRDQQQGPPRGYDSRRGPPMNGGGYDDRRGGAPQYFDGGNNRGRSPPRNMDPSSFRRDRSRSPPPAMDDRRGGGGFESRGGGSGPPPAAPSGGYGSGASAYFRGPPRY